MRRVRCYECGKSYDYDEDGFYPKCGAFNLPTRSDSIGADGRVIRREGINERNHRGSFVHAELHGENRERRGTKLSQGVKRGTHTPGQQKKSRRGNPMTVIFWVVFGIIVLNIFSSFLFLLI